MINQDTHYTIKSTEFFPNPGFIIVPPGNIIIVKNTCHKTSLNILLFANTMNHFPLSLSLLCWCRILMSSTAFTFYSLSILHLMSMSSRSKRIRNLFYKKNKNILHIPVLYLCLSFPCRLFTGPEGGHKVSLLLSPCHKRELISALNFYEQVTSSTVYSTDLL